MIREIDVCFVDVSVNIGGVLKNTKDFRLRQNICVIQRKHQGFANGECGHSGMCVMIRHV